MLNVLHVWKIVCVCEKRPKSLWLVQIRLIFCFPSEGIIKQNSSGTEQQLSSEIRLLYVRIKICVPLGSKCVCKFCIPTDDNALSLRSSRGYATAQRVHFSPCQDINRVGGLKQWRSHQSKKVNTDFTISHVSPQSMNTQMTHSECPLCLFYNGKRKCK